MIGYIKVNVGENMNMFSFILGSNGSNQMPWGIVQNFRTPGSAQGAKFGAQWEQIATLNFVPF